MRTIGDRLAVGISVSKSNVNIGATNQSKVTYADIVRRNGAAINKERMNDESDNLPYQSHSLNRLNPNSIK